MTGWLAIAALVVAGIALALAGARVCLLALVAAYGEPDMWGGPGQTRSRAGVAVAALALVVGCGSGATLRAAVAAHASPSWQLGAFAIGPIGLLGGLRIMIAFREGASDRRAYRQARLLTQMLRALPDVGAASLDEQRQDLIRRADANATQRRALLSRPERASEALLAIAQRLRTALTTRPSGSRRPSGDRR